MIDINRLCQIYIKLNKIRITLPDDFEFSDEIIQYLYDDLARDFILYSSRIETIEFCFISKTIPLLIRNQMASHLQDDFDNIGWIISIPNDESIYFTKIKAKINPKYKPLAPALKSRWRVNTLSDHKEESISFEKHLHEIDENVSLKNKAKSTENISFHEIIPYKTNLFSPVEQVNACPLLQKETDVSNLWRSHVTVALFINLVCQAHTVIEFGFIYYADTPYRWIAAVFFGISQLILLVVWGICCKRLEERLSNAVYCVEWIVSIPLFILGFILFPVIPVFVYVTWRTDTESSENAMIRTHLWSCCFCCFVIAIFQAFPQLIMLTVMFSNYGYELSTDDTFIDRSFWSSIATLLSFIVCLASIYEISSIYLLNIIWLCLDYVIFLFILSIIFYDTNGVIMFVIDYSILVAPFIWCTYWRLFFIYAKEAFLDDIHENMHNFWLYFSEIVEGTLKWLCFACLVTFGVLTFFLWIVVPIVLLMIGPWTFFLICMASQILECNIFPYCVMFDNSESNYKFRGRLYQWISAGLDEHDRSVRLVCANMVILDTYRKNENKWLELKEKILICCMDEHNLGADSIKAVRQSKYQRFKINFKHPDIDEEGQETSHILNVFFLSKVIHVILPMMIILYIGWNENWTFESLNFMMKYLGMVTIILYICCIVASIMVWISLDYHRLIIPPDYSSKEWYSTSKVTAKEMKYIVNCYCIISMKTLLIDKVGSKDIAELILDYVCNFVEKTEILKDSENESDRETNNWKTYYNNDGVPYYFNTKTGETTWNIQRGNAKGYDRIDMDANLYDVYI